MLLIGCFNRVYIRVCYLRCVCDISNSVGLGNIYSLQVTIKTNLLAELKHQAPNFGTKSLTHQTGNYPVTCFVSRPSRITLVKFAIRLYGITCNE